MVRKAEWEVLTMSYLQFRRDIMENTTGNVRRLVVMMTEVGFYNLPIDVVHMVEDAIAGTYNAVTEGRPVPTYALAVLYHNVDGNIVVESCRRYQDVA